MADEWKKAHDTVRGAYSVFKPSAKDAAQMLDPGPKRVKIKMINKARAQIVAANILSLGLSNVYTLIKAKSNLEKKQFNNLLSQQIHSFATLAAPAARLDPGELADYMRYRLNIVAEPPQTNPVTDTAFAFGWQEVKATHQAKLSEFGIA